MPLNQLRSLWEQTSFELEKLQSSSVTAMEEQAFLMRAKSVPWKATFEFGDEGGSDEVIPMARGGLICCEIFKNKYINTF
jgi:hypothetical protein